MKKMRTYIAGLLLLVMSVFVLVPVSTVGAQGALGGVCQKNGDTGVCEENQKSENANTNVLVKNIVNVLLYIIGAISVVMIIIGGLLMVTSHGDSSSLTKAKNTILYAVVGLIVAFLAYAIINWVVAIFDNLP